MKILARAGPNRTWKKPDTGIQQQWSPYVREENLS